MYKWIYIPPLPSDGITEASASLAVTEQQGQWGL